MNCVSDLAVRMKTSNIELLHHLDLVERHGAEGIVDVALTTIRGADAPAAGAPRSGCGC
jgi:hypothetical protein